MSDAVTKKYVDDLIADNVGNTDGNYQATHTINMGFKKLLNLSMSSEPFEAATKEYVDDVAASKKYVDDKDTAIRQDLKKIRDDLNTKIEFRSDHIPINAEAEGPLIADKYQFRFGQ